MEFVGRSVFLNNRNRDLFVICGHWTSRFACSLCASGTEICFRFYRFLNNKNRTEPNRNRSVRTGFGFKILKLIMSVWLIFLCKNRTEPEMLNPSWNDKLKKQKLKKHVFNFASLFASSVEDVLTYEGLYKIIIIFLI